jgi:hypothetical protein
MTASMDGAYIASHRIHPTKGTIMRQTSVVRNPFILMLDPDVVLAAVQRSEVLERLSRRVCHPLDRPTPQGAKPGPIVKPSKPITDD